MDDFRILEVAAQEIADDPKPYKDVREAFRVFARKVRRMKKEQVAESNKRIASYNKAISDGTSTKGLLKDEDIPF